MPRNTPETARNKPAASAIRRIFATRLRAARTLKYTSQADMARAIGVEIETYRRWERGETEPDISNLSKIVAELGIGLDTLIPALVPDKRG